MAALMDNVKIPYTSAEGECLALICCISFGIGAHVDFDLPIYPLLTRHSQVFDVPAAKGD